MRFTRRQLSVSALIGTVAIIALWCAVALPRIGKTKVDVRVIPASASVTQDGKSIKPGELYLAPGTYTFKASANGYTEDTRVVTVNDQDVIVGLLPEPSSDAAQRYINDNPAVQSQREALGGINAEREGLQSRNENPIMAKLPRIDPKSLYAIDYGFTNEEPAHFYIVINNSSPEGREDAIAWLKSQKLDISATDIRYDDFQNPLLQ